MSRLLAACLVTIPALAHADGWLVLEAPAALAVSDVQESVFRPGLMPAAGLYAERSHFALGVRVRGGILRNGPAPGSNLADPTTGGLTTASLAARVGVHGAWAELVGGGGITGHDVVPAMEVGVGWMMAVGSVDIGPSVRYLRVVSRDTMAAFGTAEIALVGVDVQFGKARPKHRHVVAAVAKPAPVEPVASDNDRAVDRDETCDDCGGEKLAEDIVIKNDRIVLDERVLFDFDRARVKSHGREVIAQLTKIWHEHPDWERITVEGHADVRGTDDYNQQLSERRAAAVRAVMVQAGCSGDLISTVGYGRSHLRDSGESEQAHQRNRRVEFVIERAGGQP